ncbi:MAG: hypothetical protein COV00_01665, partial [Candidatus Tagabacteria bacterium CG10_big_fil_rev_8_21_14_0_10_40_13]
MMSPDLPKLNMLTLHLLAVLNQTHILLLGQCLQLQALLWTIMFTKLDLQGQRPMSQLTLFPTSPLIKKALMFSILKVLIVQEMWPPTGQRWFSVIPAPPLFLMVL